MTLCLGRNFSDPWKPSDSSRYSPSTIRTVLRTLSSTLYSAAPVSSLLDTGSSVDVISPDFPNRFGFAPQSKDGYSIARFLRSNQYVSMSDMSWGLSPYEDVGSKTNAWTRHEDVAQSPKFISDGRTRSAYDSVVNAPQMVHNTVPSTALSTNSYSLAAHDRWSNDVLAISRMVLKAQRSVCGLFFPSSSRPKCLLHESREYGC